MTLSHILLFVLFSPDTYIYIGWGLLLTLTLAVGWGCWRCRRKWVRFLLLLPLLLCWWVFLWGAYVGVRQIEVVHVEFASADLPEAFDGYRIVQFGDAHVGTFTGWRSEILKSVVDSINAQDADMVAFTGDLQNKEPDEIKAKMSLLSTIKARDGVFSVLGNHDYALYLDEDDPEVIDRNLGNTQSYQLDMGWTLLNNGRRRISRDSASIVVAGMENDGEGRFPQRGNINDALFGVSRSEFVVMLEHDPTSWRRKILPHCHAQLTLSGHTHGGHLHLLGWTPASLVYRDYQGLYRMGSRALYVTKGIGGVVPFRFATPAEIVVITLRCSPRAK